MPDANGNIKGIALTGKAGETLERIFGPKAKSPFTEDALRAIVRDVLTRDCRYTAAEYDQGITPNVHP